MSDADKKLGAAGLSVRIGATAGLLSLCVLSTVRHASGAFEAASIPVATLTGQNGIITGTSRMMGDRFLLYNGTRLESMADSMEVSFERGGSMVLCPRSQLQILTSKGSTGMMLAFQSGGAQQPFPLRMGDEVITPDWRVELTSDARKGEMGLVQIVTNRHGDLCLQGNSQTGAYFRVTPLIGDGSFRVTGGSGQRFSDGKMESSTDSCGCDAEFTAHPLAATPGVMAGSAAVGTATAPRMVAETQMPAPLGSPVEQDASSFSPASAASAQPSPVAAKKKREHSHDVAGYVGSFVHMLFGR